MLYAAWFAAFAVGLVARVGGVVLVDLRCDLVPQFCAARVAGSGLELGDSVQRRHVLGFSFAGFEVAADRRSRLGKLVLPLRPA